MNKPSPLLFSCSIRHGSLYAAIDLPGWSHAGPDNASQWRKIFFFARNRTKAAQQLTAQGLSEVRDLDEGRKTTLGLTHTQAAAI